MFTEEGEWIRLALIEAMKDLRSRPPEQCGPYRFTWKEK